MNTIEKIRAEIERMHQEAVDAAIGNNTDWLRSRIGTLVDIMDLLDTLEEEPVDLEKDAVSYCFDNGINLSPRQAEDFARHFYELGRNAK